MFLHETAYRLGEFILIERSSFLLTWVLQNPMGMQRSGKCHIIGDILVLMPWETYSPGYLRMEFHDYLIKLPLWRKTSSFCIASGLRRVDIGMLATDDVLEQLATKAINVGTLKSLDPGAFQLGRYKIIASDDNAIAWQAIGPNNRIVCGKGCIESGILILDSEKVELDEGTRRSFYSELKTLPPWNQTTVWGHAKSIKSCKHSSLNKDQCVITFSPGFTDSFPSDRLSSILSKGNASRRGCERNTPENEPHQIKWKSLGKLAMLTPESTYRGFRQSIPLFGNITGYFARKYGLLSKAATDKKAS
ncbi:hypothetical protein [Desulfopila aestuarii]|uniref:Uncharacterized protein n=1 Tax=Desulfopila aestuarii DSM 18488 TaxID=1121416 RepID=A0A1M7YLY2_9BACT|nr:hypothetical protein [Desulfopila aestuarii]SHO53635.1 hypothetical protein SAMN02745220_05236 [Desulfopila aestuarii DSM 18488]